MTRHPGRKAICWSLVCGSLVAPALALEPSWELSQYRVDTWTQRQGLPQASVLAIVQDRAGYLWLGTQEGVARFDGVAFEHFTVENTPALGQNFVNALFEDATGRLWFGTDGGTLATYRHGRFEAFVTGPEFRGRVVGIGSDTRGTVYVAFRQAGLFRVGSDGLEAVALETGRPTPALGALARGPSGLWLGGEGGIYQQQSTGWVAISLPWAAGRLVTALAPGDDGSVWVASGDSQLLEISVTDGTAELRRAPVELAGAVRDLGLDTAGVLWVATEAGLYRWRARAGETSPERLTPTPVGIVDTVREDREGGLWIGTRGEGLVRLRSDEIMPFGTPEGLPNEATWNVFGTSDGTLYVSTEGGLARVEGGRVETLPSALFPTSDTVALGAAGDGSLLVGTFRHGLFRRTATSGEWRHVDLAGSLPPSPITVVHEDRRGQLWVGSRDGLARQSNGRFAAVPLLTGTAQPFVSAIVEDSAGTVWVATTAAGLFGFEGDAVRRYGPGEGLPSSQLNALHLDRKGRLWIATNDRGLAVLAEGRVGRVGTRHGLPHALVLWLVEDRQDHLWLSTNHGLVRVATEELAQVAFGAKPALAMRLLTESDGMRGVGFSGTGQPAGWCAVDGRVWFPSGNGLAVGDPARLGTPSPPRAEIRRLASDGVARSIVPGVGAVALQPGRGEVELEVTAPHFDEPEGLGFRYRLAGFDDSWRDGGTSRTVRYTNLPPGRYRFEVAARHQDGGSWGPVAALDLTLAPTLVQSWPFRASLALLATTLAAAAIRWRSRRLHALVARRTAELVQTNQELEAAVAREHAARSLAEVARSEAEHAASAKSDFLAIVSHELRTPLNAILGLSDLLLDTPLDERQREWQKLVQKSGMDLLGIVDELLDLARMEHDRLELLAQPFDLARCLETAVSMAAMHASQKGLSIRFDYSPRELCSVVGDELRVRQVANNLLANAVKFTERGEVAVTARVFERGDALELELEVKDTGAGIPQALQAAIFQPFVQAEAPLTRRHGGVGLGLAIATRLCRAMGGRIDVESTPGAGSVFRAFMRLARSTISSTDTSPVATRETPLEPVPQPGSAGPTLPPTVLVVEDDPVNRVVAGAMLESLGLDCDFAVDGETALEAVSTRYYDVVLLDLQLPGIDGFEVASRIRGGAALGRPSIVALTASAMQRERDRSREVGMDGFLSKPLRPAELAEVLERLQSGRGPRSAGLG